MHFKCECLMIKYVRVEQYSESMINLKSHLRYKQYLRISGSTQASIPLGYVNWVPAYVAGVMWGMLTGNTVIPYGRWHSVALRWVFHEELYYLTIHHNQTVSCKVLRWHWIKSRISSAVVNIQNFSRTLLLLWLVNECSVAVLLRCS